MIRYFPDFFLSLSLSPSPSLSLSLCALMDLGSVWATQVKQSARSGDFSSKPVKVKTAIALQKIKLL